MKLKLSSTQLLNKVFNGKSKGYDPLEVDEFLDEVITDYLLVENNVLLKKEEYDSLIKNNKDYKDTIREQEIVIANYKNKFNGIADNKNISLENIEYLQRINALEKYIYSLGKDPTKIK
ncbi:MAG: DivIVA domain-containing protein [Bacilli bacterium]